MQESRSQPSHRVIARFSGTTGAHVLAEVVAILQGHGADTELLTLRRVPGVADIEVRADVVPVGGSITAILRELAAFDHAVSVSAENLLSRSTYIVPL